VATLLAQFGKEGNDIIAHEAYQGLAGQALGRR
jgi:hypothetical protein